MKKLVLLGGGHAHLKVLASLAEKPLTGWEVQLISPYRRQIYSGMLSGWLAGDYSLESCAIALDRLAIEAAVEFREEEASNLDLEHRSVSCTNGCNIHYDVLSIDTGSAPSLEALPGAHEHALPVRPIEQFVATWPAIAEQIHESRRFELLIVGDGAAGVELAFAIKRRGVLQAWRNLTVTLVGTDELPLPSMSRSARLQAAHLLSERGIFWYGRARATHVDQGSLMLAGRQPLNFDACIIATGPSASPWLRRSGLATNADGYIQVTPTLQSISHSNVFAAGDVAAYTHPRPKSGVYAVRAGPVLANNLRAYCEERVLRSWIPQSRALYILNIGDRNALATRGSFSWSGRWPWIWKDHIDRQFVARFAST